jgi:hypothetical protein
MGFVLMLSGCTMPRHPDALHDSSSRAMRSSASYCYAHAEDVVGERVKSYWKACFLPETLKIETVLNSKTWETMTVEVPKWYTVEKDQIPGGKRYALRENIGLDYVFKFSAEIKENSSQCKSELKMYAFGVGLEKDFDRIDNTIRGGAIDCAYKR